MMYNFIQLVHVKKFEMFTMYYTCQIRRLLKSITFKITYNQL